MSTPATASARRPRPRGQVGVRELRQNLSVYLARVVAGETLKVTDRGRAVAVLAPLPPPSTLVQRLAASGRAVPATLGLSDLPPLSGRVPRARVQKALEESREDKV